MNIKPVNMLKSLIFLLLLNHCKLDRINLTEKKNRFVVNDKGVLSSEIRNKSTCFSCEVMQNFTFEHDKRQELQPSSTVLYHHKTNLIVFSNGKIFVNRYIKARYEERSILNELYNIEIKLISNYDKSNKVIKFHRGQLYKGKRLLFIFFEGFVSILEEQIDEHNNIKIKSLETFSTQFKEKKIDTVIDHKDYIIVGLESSKIAVVYIGEGTEFVLLKKVEQNFFFPHKSLQKKSKFKIINLQKSKKIKKGRKEVEFCLENKKAVNSDLLDKRCFTLENVLLDLFLMEPNGTSDKSELKVSLYRLLKTDSIKTSTLKLSENDLMQVVHKDKIKLRFFKDKTGVYFTVNKNPTKHKTSSGIFPTIDVFERHNDSYVLVLRDNKKVMITQFFPIYSPNHSNNNNNLKLDVKTRTTQMTLDSISADSFHYMAYSSYLVDNGVVILAHLRNYLITTTVDLDSTEIVCDLKKFDYIQFSCKTDLELEYLDEMKFMNGYNTYSTAYSSKFYHIVFRIHKFDYNKLMGFCFIFLLLLIVFFLMKKKSERNFRKKYKKVPRHVN